LKRLFSLGLLICGLGCGAPATRTDGGTTHDGGGGDANGGTAPIIATAAAASRRHTVRRLLRLVQVEGHVRAWDAERPRGRLMPEHRLGVEAERMRLTWLVPLIIAAGCASPTLDDDLAASCSPLRTRGACMLPWPNAIYLETDTSTPTGRRLALPSETLPVNAGGVTADPTRYNRADGFSPATPILVGTEA
jgi:hypothetical protein